MIANFIFFILLRKRREENWRKFRVVLECGRFKSLVSSTLHKLWTIILPTRWFVDAHFRIILKLSCILKTAFSWAHANISYANQFFPIEWHNRMRMNEYPEHGGLLPCCMLYIQIRQIHPNNRSLTDRYV